MSYVTTKDGIQIYYKDWGNGQPVVFRHGWPLSADDWDAQGDANGAPHPPPSSYAQKFSAKYEHRTIKGGIGHNLPEEAPQAFAKTVIDVDHF